MLSRAMLCLAAVVDKLPHDWKALKDNPVDIIIDSFKPKQYSKLVVTLTHIRTVLCDLI